jgi:hypothetical protein
MEGCSCKLIVRSEYRSEAVQVIAHDRINNVINAKSIAKTYWVKKSGDKVMSKKIEKLMNELLEHHI